MKRTGKCPKCGGDHIIADAKAIDRADHHTEKEMTLATFKQPEAILFKGKQTTSVSAWVCVGCGFVEFYADEPATLKITGA